METDFKLEKLELVKVPVLFRHCDGCIFQTGSKEKECAMLKIPEETKQKIIVRVFERLCPDDTKLSCVQSEDGFPIHYIFLYSRY